MKGKIKTTLLIAVLLLSTLTIAIPLANAATINVPGDQATIQAAIDAASPGDTILVAAGTYAPFTVEDVTGLTIKAVGDVYVVGVQTVTIYEGVTGSPFMDGLRDAVIFVTGSTDILLEGLTIGPNTGQTNPKDYSVIYEDSTGTIRDCDVSPETEGDLNSVAIAIWDGSDVDVESCIAHNYGRIGVYIYEGCTVDISDSSIEGQVYSGEGEVCYGIEVEGAWQDSSPQTASHVTIKGTEIYNNDNTFATSPTWSSGGMLLNGWLEYFDAADSTVKIENCDIHHNYAGIYAIKSPTSYAHYNNIHDNRVYGVESCPAIDTTTAVFDATLNWWGDASGPNGEGSGSGDAVSTKVDFYPWLLNPIEAPNLDPFFYCTGDTVTATIHYASALNADPIRTDTVEVKVTSTTDTTGFLMDLTETGINTGRFTGSFPLVEPINPGPKELGVNDGDAIELEIDASGKYENPVPLATVDDVAPVVTITAPTEAFINGDSVAVTATVLDETPVTYSFKIDGVTFATVKPATLDTTEYTDGEYTITVEATDGAGNTGSKDAKVNIDNTGPEVTNYVSDPPVSTPDSERTIELSASVLDAGVDAPLEEGEEGYPAEDPIVTIDLSEIKGPSEATIIDPVEGVYTYEYTLPGTLTVGLYNLPITAEDSLGNENTEAVIVFEVLEDAVNPMIVSTEVDYDLGATSATVGSDVTITVIATDDLSGIESVSIDATEIGGDAIESMDEDELLDDTWTATLTVGANVEVGTKTLTITATDYADNEATELVEVEVATDITGLYVDLEEDWNLFSLPLIPDDSSIEVVLADVMENVEIVWGYKEGVWSKYLPGLPEFSALTDLVDGEGYWVLMTAEDTVTVSGVELPGPGILPPVYDVVKGWNMIGFKSVDVMDIDTYLTTIPETVLDSSVSYGWNAAVQDYELVYLGDFVTGAFDPGQGYWLYLTEDANIAPPTS